MAYQREHRVPNNDDVLPSALLILMINEQQNW